MIGRAAQGRPWIFREIRYFLEHGRRSASPTMAELRTILMRHLCDLYELYGEFLGVRVARKHIGWYTRGLRGAEGFRTHFNGLETGHEQLAAVERLFADPARCGEQAERREERAA